MKNRKLLGKNVLKKPYLPNINVMEDNNYPSINKWRYVFYFNLHKSDRQKSCINIWPQGITQIYKEKHLKEAYRVIPPVYSVCDFYAYLKQGYRYKRSQYL